MRILLPAVLMSAIIIHAPPAQAQSTTPMPATPGINIPSSPLANFVDTINDLVGLILLGPSQKTPSSPRRPPNPSDLATAEAVAAEIVTDMYLEAEKNGTPAGLPTS